MSATEYPECDKMQKVQPKSQTIGEFLDWLQCEKRVHLTTVHEHSDACRDEDGRLRDSFGNPNCGYVEGSYQPIHTSVEKLLAEYFEIDLDKVEKEKRQILASLRK